ncbi:MAG: RNA polymerase sigma factor [Gammaproteobacteria bacterium]|nr:RNA polymerase sigma factor [Gammaproteobacteria bacterium]NNJ50426.1 RNA polymerase sigma factor [Gammaproteobacteria bacterium]
MSIVKLFKSHNRPADRFTQLVSPEIEVLYRFAYRLCQNTDDAEDLVQQLLTRLFHKLEELERIESLRPWLMRSLYNLYVDSYRKQQSMLRVISPGEMPDNVVSAEATPHERAELTDRQQVILAAMRQLNDDQRMVMMLHDAEGYTLPELADILQTPIGTLKSRLHRGRNQVKEMTEKELFGHQQRDISEEEHI